eukprot:XP_017177341.1 PREDICTED: extensin-like isoform X2 [Mus musculus]
MGAATPYLNRTNDDDTTPDTPPYSYLNTAHTPPAQPHLTPTARPHTQPQHQQLRSLIRPPNTLHSLPSSLPPSRLPHTGLPCHGDTCRSRREPTLAADPEPGTRTPTCRRLLPPDRPPATSDQRRATSDEHRLLAGPPPPPPPPPAPVVSPSRPPPSTQLSRQTLTRSIRTTPHRKAERRLARPPWPFLAGERASKTKTANSERLLALRLHPRSALPDLEASLTVLHSSSEPGGSAGAPRAPTWCSSNTHSSAFLSSLSGRPGPWATRPP